MSNSIDKHKGIIYQCSNSWICGIERFIVIKFINDSSAIVKLLDKPNYQSQNRELALGYAQVSITSINSCKIIQDNRNITEYLKSMLFE